MGAFLITRHKVLVGKVAYKKLAYKKAINEL